MKVILDTRPQRGKASIVIISPVDDASVQDLCNIRDLFNDAMIQIATLTINNLDNATKTRN